MMFRPLQGKTPNAPSRLAAMARRVFVAVAALACVAIFLPASALARQEIPKAEDVLILYEEGPAVTVEPKVMALCDIFTYTSRNYECSSVSEAGDVEGYGFIVLIADPTASMPGSLIERLKAVNTPVMVIGGGALEELGIDADAYSGVFSISYDFFGDRSSRWETGDVDISIPRSYEGDYGGTIKIAEGLEFPLCVKAGHISSIAWFDPSMTTMIPAVASILTDWMWPFLDRPHSYSGYLVLDMVYPFVNLEHMMAITDMLIEENAPYAIAVMPLYDNAHFPAMKRFCEYLRYAQSKGAAIVLRTPIVTLAQTNPGEIRERIALAYEAYVQYGVYPLAIEAPKAYLYTEAGLEVLRITRTVLLFETDDAIPEIPRVNLSFNDGHNIIAPAYTDWTHLYGSAFSSAVYLDVNMDAETLRMEVRSYKDSAVSLRSLWSISNVLYVTDNYFFNVEDGNAYLNGARLDLKYSPFQYEQSADFNRGFMRFLTEQLEASNRVIMVMVALAVLVSCALILFARKRMKRVFFRKKTAPEGMDKGVGL